MKVKWFPPFTVDDDGNMIDLRGVCVAQASSDAAPIERIADVCSVHDDLIAMVERLVHHCNGGAWAGREQREQIVKDLEAADAVIAKAKWA